LNTTIKTAITATTTMIAIIIYRVSKGRNIPGCGVGVIEVDGLGV
jgi:hypothetical protein